MSVRVHIPLLALCVLVALSSPASAQRGPARIGFEENFDTSDGWQLSAGAPLRHITSERGTVTFHTQRGALGSHMPQSTTATAVPTHQRPARWAPRRRRLHPNPCA